MTIHTASTHGPGFLRAEDCRLDDLLDILGAGTDLADYPHAAEVAQGVLLYDADALRDAMTDDDARRVVHAEIARALAGARASRCSAAPSSTAWSTA